MHTPKTWPRLRTALWASLWLMTSWALAACGSSAPTVVDGNRYVVSGALSSSQMQCTADAPSRKWAVVVGINFYQDERIPDLTGAVNDAWSFYHFLSSPKGAGIDPFRLRLLLNEEATRRGVEDALGEFLQYACPQDQIIIYFAGHGAPEPDKPEEAFLLVHDTDLNSMVSTAVSMTQLPNFLKWRTGQTGNLLMLIDACHSGNIAFPGQRGFKVGETITLDDTRKAEEARAKSVTKSVDKLVEGNEGWGAISATAPDQFAGETAASCIIGGEPYAGGIFTCYLLEGLSGAADADKDGNVTLGETFDHLVVKVSQARDGKQIPQRSGLLDDSMVLANTKSMAIDIPQVPERYLYETFDQPLRPYAYAAAGLTAAALGAAIFFNLEANSDAQRMDDFVPSTGTRADFDGLRDSRDQNVTLAVTAYATSAALAAITLSLISWEIFDEPEGIEDVYQKEPWLRIGVAPTGQGDGAAVQLQLQY